MASHKLNSYFGILGKTPIYQELFSQANQLYEKQLIFLKIVPSHLAPHCRLGQISNGKLIIQAENSSIASKLKLISPSLLLKLQKLEWEVTAIQILVQAHYYVKNQELLLNQKRIKRKSTLSRSGKACLSQFAATLPNSELKNAIQVFLEKQKRSESE
mgnify:CR=1 FL=1